MGERIGCINSLIAGAIAPFFIFPSIYLSFYPLNAPPDGGKCLTASEQIGEYSGEIFFREVRKIAGEKRWKLGFGIAYGEIKYI